MVLDLIMEREIVSNLLQQEDDIMMLFAGISLLVLVEYAVYIKNINKLNFKF